MKPEALSTKNQPSIGLKTPKTKLCTRQPMHHNELGAGPLNYWPPEAPFEAPKNGPKNVKKRNKIQNEKSNCNATEN